MPEEHIPALTEVMETFAAGLRMNRAPEETALALEALAKTIRKSGGVFRVNRSALALLAGACHGLREDLDKSYPTRKWGEAANSRLSRALGASVVDALAALKDDKPTIDLLSPGTASLEV
jgi:hypothetical protein